MNSQRRQSIPRGFTLIELLVAMVITTIIVSVLVSVTSLAMDTWNRSRSELRAARQAKTIADSMANDFEALVTRRGNTNEWLSAIIDASTPTIGPANLSNANACRLVFFTAAADRYSGDIGTAFPTNAGDVSCVAYQLFYQDPLGSTKDAYKTFVLNRVLMHPHDTFLNLLGKTDATDLTKSLDKIFTAACPLATKPPLFTSDPVTMADTKNFVCENLCQFALTFHVQVASTATPPVISDVPVTMGGAVKRFRILGSQIDTDYSGDLSALVPTGRVTAIELSVSVVSDYGLDQIKKRTFTGADGDKAKAKLLGQNIYQYSKRVQVPGM